MMYIHTLYIRILHEIPIHVYTLYNITYTSEQILIEVYYIL